MGVFTYTMAELNSPVAPARFFPAFCTDSHNFLPNVMPQFVKSIDFIEGDSTTVGCIKQLNFPVGAPFKYVKNRVEEIDLSKFYIKYTSFEGDVLDDNLESVVMEDKFEPSGSGTRFRMIAHYHTKGKYEISEESLSKRRESVKKMFNIVEEYLISNPQVYV